MKKVALSRHSDRKSDRSAEDEPSGVRLADVVRRAAVRGEIETHLASFEYGRQILANAASGKIKAERDAAAADPDHRCTNHAPGDFHDAEDYVDNALKKLREIAAVLDEELRGADEANGNRILLDALRDFAKVRINLDCGLDQLRRGIADFDTPAVR